MEFDSFVRQEIPQAYRYARLLTGSSHTAHDVVADVLPRARSNALMIVQTPTSQPDDSRGYVVSAAGVQLAKNRALLFTGTIGAEIDSGSR